MKIIVLGSAAGGGFPQWNCNSHLSRKARLGEPTTRPRTQSSIAVSANGSDFVLFNASPDLRHQILNNPLLHPGSTSLRDSPIRAVVLTNGDVDHVAGLLTLRERHPFQLYASNRVLRVLEDNPIFQVLALQVVTRNCLNINKKIDIRDSNETQLGLAVTPFAVPGKVPLYLEDENESNFGTQEGDTIGLKIEQSSSGVAFYYIPACAQVDTTLKNRLRDAALIFFDGTLYVNDEMIMAGVGEKTGARMGHINMTGNNGSIESLQNLNIKRKIFIHINNTNPVLDDGSAERQFVEENNWEVSYDGMTIDL